MVDSDEAINKYLTKFINKIKGRVYTGRTKLKVNVNFSLHDMHLHFIDKSSHSVSTLLRTGQEHYNRTFNET